MVDIYAAVTAFLRSDEWPYSDMESGQVARTAFKGDNGQFACYAQARQEQQQFIFYSVCPVTVPDGKRPLVAEFLTRANYGMILGNFEMDYRDGEVRYKTSIDSNGEDLSEGLIRPVVYSNVMMMDRYLPGIMKLVYGDSYDAEAAIAEIENSGE